MIRISSLAARKLLDRGVAKADASYPTTEELTTDPVLLRVQQIVQDTQYLRNQADSSATKINELVRKEAEPKKPAKYKFTVVRNKEGLIETITADEVG